MGRKLVLVGGGHAHMVTLANLDHFVEKGHEVTVVGPSEYHYYSGMGPGMLGRTYSPDDIRFATRFLVEKKGARFLKDKVTHINPDAKTVHLESGNSLAYDVLSFNAGSYVPRDRIRGDDANIFSVKPIERLMQAQEKLLDLMSQKEIIVSIIGGGPSSAEIAGNVWQLSRQAHTHAPQIQVFAGKKFMTRFPESVRSRILNILKKRDIIFHEGAYVDQVTDSTVTLENGRTYNTDFTFLALGVKPSTIFERSGLPTGPDKGLLVNSFLQSTRYPDIFGGGDCIHFKEQPLDKVGVYAVRQNPVLYHNLMARLENRSLMPFDPGPDYLLIFNVGGSKGVLKKHGLVFGGRLAFKIKDYIDVKFMKKFQAYEQT
ncbi:MAG: pyridine nucleotide-disulfide oxidoreductase [Desulfobacteraceae bacterium]|nr:MAG: pyridine nucleotide-disulfide oxidoreductase [Desulfobacteraceae bacterium]